LDIRFHIDPDTELPHIHGHGVRESEVAEVLAHPGEDRAGYDDARIAIGKTSGGRILKVVYVPGEIPGSVFVITAYTLVGKPLAAYRRRMRGRQRG
jgi:hypothetical protein